MAGKIQWLIGRTPFEFKAVPQQTETGIVWIARNVPVINFREVSLDVCVHVTTTGGTGSKMKAYVLSALPSPDDPTQNFTTTPIASLDIPTGSVAGSLLKLDVAPQSSTPVNAGAYVSIALTAVGATSGATDVTGTLSMALVCKE